MINIYRCQKCKTYLDDYTDYCCGTLNVWVELADVDSVEEWLNEVEE